MASWPVLVPVPGSYRIPKGLKLVNDAACHPHPVPGSYRVPKGLKRIYGSPVGLLVVPGNYRIPKGLKRGVCASAPYHSSGQLQNPQGIETILDLEVDFRGFQAATESPRD